VLLAVRVIIPGKLPSPAPVRVQLPLKVAGGIGRPDPASVYRGAECSRTLGWPDLRNIPGCRRPDRTDRVDRMKIRKIQTDKPDGTDATTKERPSRPRPVCTGWGSCSVQSAAAVDFSGSLTNQR
jgi:hypothetical protein